MKSLDDIRDDEIRVIGKQDAFNADAAAPSMMNEAGQTGTGRRRWPVILIAALACAALAALLVWLLHRPAESPENVPVVYEPENVVPAESRADEPLALLGDYSDTTKAYTEHLRDSINDIPLDIYIPHNATPRLFIGTPALDDKKVIFTTQAADIRADNGKITGAFVLAGKPVTWGLSKKGYCGIIDGKVTVGVADDSPLFEKATETGGYFFRQYPLVDNGTLVENEPKGKAIRKAVCDRAGEIIIVMTRTNESFHDFAQVLIDLGVSNAIYLVGSTSYGYFRDKYDQLSIIYDKQRGGQLYENHLQWVE